jgi:hypothetical protein
MGKGTTKSPLPGKKGGVVSIVGDMSSRQAALRREEYVRSRERAARDDRVKWFFDQLLRVWIAAGVVVTVVVFVRRALYGPVPGAWIPVLVLTWAAPFAFILLNFLKSWVWFVLWLVTYPFKPLRESRFMKSDRWHPAD